VHLTLAIQEALVALLCFDDEASGASMIRSLVPLSAYDAYYRDIAEAAISYNEQYQEAPREHTYDLVETLIARYPDREEIYGRIFNSLSETRNGINRNYVVQQAQVFARFQSLRSGIKEALDSLKAEDEAGVMLAEGAIAECLKSTTEICEPGILLSDATQSLRFLDEDETVSFKTGIEEIDSKGLGPARKRLHVFVGLPGAGKSWWLVNLAKQALLNRQRVVYVTLELSEVEVSQRLIQSLYSVSKRKIDYQTHSFERDELGRFVDMHADMIVNRPSFVDQGIRKTLTKKLKPLKQKPELWVKEFPTASLTINQLNAYLDSLEATKKMIPDLLIVDYADLMTLGTDNYRLDVGSLYKRLRGLAITRNIGVATASQANRSARTARVITDEHIAEDYSKIATADYVISYNQTQDEHDLSLARLFVIKGRTEQDKFEVLISQAYGLGQFVIDSVGKISSYWNQMQAQGGDDD